MIGTMIHGDPDPEDLRVLPCVAQGATGHRLRPELYTTTEGIPDRSTPGWIPGAGAGERLVFGPIPGGLRGPSNGSLPTASSRKGRWAAASTSGDAVAELTRTVCALMVRRPAICAASTCSRRFLASRSGILTATREASISGEDHDETLAICRRLARGGHAAGGRQCQGNHKDRRHQRLFQSGADRLRRSTTASSFI